MRLEDVLSEYPTAVRQKHGFTAIVECTSSGYAVRLIQDGSPPHFEETYPSLEVVQSLFSTTCSWRPAPSEKVQLLYPTLHIIQHRLTPIQVDRFWAKVDRDTAECWIWRGNRNTSSGYGMARVENGRMLAHRLSWELEHNVTLSQHEYILHRSVEEGCGNILCVRPTHLYISNARNAPQQRTA